MKLPTFPQQAWRAGTVLAFSLAFFAWQCSLGQANGPSRLDAPFELDIVQVPDKTIFHFTSLHRLVRLETVEDSLIGRIDKVLCDEVRGDIFVIDKRSTKSIIRFDQDGRFLNRIHRVGQGPGEYEEIHDVALGPAGDLYITADHEIIRLSYDGRLIVETDIHFNVKDAVFTHGRLYVSAFSPKGTDGTSIFAFDQQLKLVDGFGQGSQLNKKFPLVPTAYLCTDADRIYLSDFLIPNIHTYGLDGRDLGVLEFPNLFPETTDLLQDPNFSTKTEKKLRQNIHHLNATFAGHGFLVLHEALLQRKDREINLFMPGNRRYYNFASMRQFTGNPDLSMESLAGVSGDDLILAVDDMEKLVPLQAIFPALAGETFQATDNPILIFFTISKGELPP